MAHLRDYFLNWLFHCLLGNIHYNITQKTMKKPIGKELESGPLAVLKEVSTLILPERQEETNWKKTRIGYLQLQSSSSGSVGLILKKFKVSSIS
jgi:hypothetical protein